MTPKPPLSTAAQVVAVLRIVLLAMVGGLVMATGVIAFLASRGTVATDSAPPGNVLQLALVGLAGGAVVIGAILPRSIARQALRRLDEPIGGADADPPQPVLGAFFAARIIPAALAEGVGLFGAIVVLLTQAWWALLFPAGAALLILAMLPGERAVQRFAAGLA